jgi:hypothetical protein
MRLDGTQLYTRNAVEDPNDKNELGKLRPLTESFGQDLIKRVNSGDPHLLITFGAFSYEFAQRSCGQVPDCNWKDRRVDELGGAFRRELEKIGPNRTNILPLLHATIARGKCLQNHGQFCGPDGAKLCDDAEPNYFEQVGDRIAAFLLDICDRNYLAKWCVSRS